MPNFSAQFVIGPSGVVETTNAAAMRTLLGLGSASTVAASSFVGTSPATATANVIQSANATSGSLILKARASQTASILELQSSGGTVLLTTGTNGGTTISPPAHVTALTLDVPHTSTVPTLILHGSSTANVLHVRDSSDNTTVYVDAQTGVVGAKRIASTVGNGTAPFSVSSTTACTNLNVEFLGGSRAADIIAAASGGGASLTGLQTQLFRAPAESWRGVGSLQPEADIPSVAGMSSSTYCLAFDSANDERAQRMIGRLPTDSSWANASVSLLLAGHAFSATSGSVAYVLAAKQTITGSWTGAFTDFATIACALPANTGSGYTGSYLGSTSTLGWSAGAALELQIRRLTTGSQTHAADTLFHSLDAYRVEA